MKKKKGAKTNRIGLNNAIIGLMKAGISPNDIIKIEVEDIIQIKDIAKNKNNYYLCIFDTYNRNSETLIIQVKGLSDHLRRYKRRSKKKQPERMFNVSKSYIYKIYSQYLVKKNIDKPTNMSFLKFITLDNVIGGKLPNDRYIIYLTEKNYIQRLSSLKSKIQSTELTKIYDLIYSFRENARIKILQDKFKKFKAYIRLKKKLHLLKDELSYTRPYPKQQFPSFALLAGNTFLYCTCGHKHQGFFIVRGTLY